LIRNMHILFNHGNFGFLEEKNNLRNLLTFFANVLRSLVRVKGRRRLPCFFLLISTHAERVRSQKCCFLGLLCTFVMLYVEYAIVTRRGRFWIWLF